MEGVTADWEASRRRTCDRKRQNSIVRRRGNCSESVTGVCVALAGVHNGRKDIKSVVSQSCCQSVYQMCVKLTGNAQGCLPLEEVFSGLLCG